MAKEIGIEEAEAEMLSEVKFVDLMLEECRSRSESLRERLGMSYAKRVGLSAPYDEAINALRKVKKELNGYLEILRSEAQTFYKLQLSGMRRKKSK